MLMYGSSNNNKDQKVYTWINLYLLEIPYKVVE